MQKCWEDTLEKRPTFSSLKTMFEAMLQENSPYIELHSTAGAYITHFPASHLLDDFKKQPLAEGISEEGASLSSTSSSSSSSSVSTTLDSSNYQLLKSCPGKPYLLLKFYVKHTCK